MRHHRQAADVHTRATTDVLHVLKMNNAVVVVVFGSWYGVFVLREDIVFDDFAHKCGFSAKVRKKSQIKPLISVISHSQSCRFGMSCVILQPVC